MEFLPETMPETKAAPRRQYRELIDSYSVCGIASSSVQTDIFLCVPTAHSVSGIRDIT